MDLTALSNFTFIGVKGTARVLSIHSWVGGQSNISLKLFIVRGQVEAVFFR